LKKQDAEKLASAAEEEIFIRSKKLGMNSISFIKALYSSCRTYDLRSKEIIYSENELEGSLFWIRTKSPNSDPPKKSKSHRIPDHQHLLSEGYTG
jgi:hypothetical protein